MAWKCRECGSYEFDEIHTFSKGKSIGMDYSCANCNNYDEDIKVIAEWEEDMFKVGDKVWSINYGWGRIIHVLEIEDGYPVEVRFLNEEGKKWDISYTSCGKLYHKDIVPSLFFKEVPIKILREYQERPRWRAEDGEMYYFVTSFGEIACEQELFYQDDDRRFDAGNYFKNEKEARESKFYKVFSQEV